MTTTKEAPVAKKKKTITSQHSKFDKIADKSAQKSGTPIVTSPTKTGKKKVEKSTISSTDDIADDTIEKVLEFGGDLEFVENGMLAEYGKIVLIKRY